MARCETARWLAQLCQTVRLWQRMHYAFAQVLVDVLGVVTSVGTMRSIKRKNDGTEFFCRDITIADAGCAVHTRCPLQASVVEESSPEAWLAMASECPLKRRMPDT